ncbi:hypothetical protein PIB30_040039 [Stylosanthes scabra]|uniref:Uncharacterized protein n=1 Tax=Stylosanthes scabra TaxID=79078 RepID=A0ABU6SFU6_9FABA|nr:hypothetical protein [Stylosanthes scabra]
MADQPLSSSKDEKSSTRRSHSSRRPTSQYSPQGISSTQRVRSSSSTMGTSSFRPRMVSSSLRMSRNWELIPPSEGWMSEGDDEKEIGGMEPSIKNEDSSEADPEEEDDPEEEEDPEEEIPASEDYLHFIEDLERCPEPSPLRCSQASVPDSPEEASDRQSDGHNASSYDLSGVWQEPLSGSIPSPSLGDCCKVRPESYFFCKATILSSNTSVYEPASRFGPALSLPARSGAKSATFEASRLNPDQTPAHLVEPVNGPTNPYGQPVHLVDWSTGLDKSMSVNHRSTPVKFGQ